MVGFRDLVGTGIAPVSRKTAVKVKKFQEDSLDSMPSPSISVTIQIMGRERYKGRTLLVDVI